MSQILNRIRDVDPNNSDAVKDVLSPFFLNLVKHTDVDCNRWLRVLESVITRFPRFCGSHRNTIESYLTSFIDSNNYYNVIEAAKCAHALQQVRPPQEKTATPKTCWREHVQLLCNAAHKLVGALFPNSIDIYKGNSDALKSQLQSSATSPFYTALAQVLSVPKTLNNSLNKQAVLGTRLRNVFVFLQAALVEIYPVPKPIQPQIIVEVIVRALSVSSGVKEAKDITRAVTVKIQALRTLDALVACLGPNLIPFSTLIFKFVILTLNWCRDNINEETSEVRRIAYGTLRRWLLALHALRPADSPRGLAWEDELAGHVVADVTPPRHLVQLTMRPQSSRHLSKKAKRKQANTMLQESSIVAKTQTTSLSQESNDDIAIAALEFVETFLNVSGIFLKPATHKILQERIVRSCYSLPALRPARALALLRALDALRTAAPAALPPPTQHCLHIYSQLQTHPAHEISKFCSQALLDIRLHLHCSPPSLNFALEVPRIQKKAVQPRLSSKNRAALESLLGAERVPQEGSENVIDLEEEPSNKKPRIDPEPDNISLSSASCAEISDDDDDEVEEVNLDEDESNSDSGDVEVDEIDGADENGGKATGEPSNSVKDLKSKEVETTEEDSRESRSKDSHNESSKDSKSKDDSQETTSKGETDDTTTNDESQESQSASRSQESDSTAATRKRKYSETEESTTQEEVEKTDERDLIHEANTQMPNNNSGEALREEARSPRSMEVEVAYDNFNTADKKVTIIDKTEDENLPSTNETDDVPITCGQIVKNSQEVDIEKSKEAENKENEEPKVNGDSKLDKTEESLPDKTAKDISVEDMLADFVDEVVDESKT